MTETILAVGAHPDDLDFSSSGTMLKLASEGHRIYYLICTNGDKGGTQNSATSKELVEIRKAEQLKAAEVIGVKEVFFLDFGDGELKADEILREKIVRVIRTVKPHRVYSFDPGNQTFDGFHLFHSDHRAVAISVFDAIFPAAKNRLYFPEHMEEGLQPHKVTELWMFGTDRPDRWTDITGLMERKKEVLLCHKSQFSTEKTRRIMEFLEERSRKAATGQPFEYAESFRRITFPF